MGARRHNIKLSDGDISALQAMIRNSYRKKAKTTVKLSARYGSDFDAAPAMRGSMIFLRYLYVNLLGDPVDLDEVDIYERMEGLFDESEVVERRAAPRGFGDADKETF